MKLSAMENILRVFLALAAGLSARADSSRAMGARLLEEGDFSGAAVEFRRAAMYGPQDDPLGVAGYYGAAGYAYVRDGRHALAEAMLDELEERTADLDFEAMLLRGENARGRKEWDNAAFCFGSARRSGSQAKADERLIAYAGRKELGALVRARDMDAALRLAREEPANTGGEESLDALRRYADGRDKKPWLGGLLGMIPGMGYLYSGEKANAVRSFVLNALFIYAMVDTAEKEQWGAFAAVTFFELTWYTGSIYGGASAAHRHNRARLDLAARSIEGRDRLRLQASAVPSLSFTIGF